MEMWHHHRTRHRCGSSGHKVAAPASRERTFNRGGGSHTRGPAEIVGRHRLLLQRHDNRTNTKTGPDLSEKWKNRTEACSKECTSESYSASDLDHTSEFFFTSPKSPVVWNLQGIATYVQTSCKTFVAMV